MNRDHRPAPTDAPHAGRIRQAVTGVEPSAQLAATGDGPQWRAAGRLRHEHPHWVVIWLASVDSYRAYPLFRAPRRTALTAATPEQLADQMSQFRQAPRGPQAQSQNQPQPP
jgi:hypothetical protein